MENENGSNDEFGINAQNGGVFSGVNDESGGVNDEKFGVKFGVNDEKFRVNDEKFRINDEKFRINDEKFRINGEKFRINDNEFGINQKKILSLIDKNPVITANEIADKLNLTERAVRKNLAKLKEMNILIRIGSRKTGEWKILKD